MIQAVDLFCGAGGTSTGLLKAAKRRGLRLQLVAINHWPTAINSHSLNHPGVRHICEELDRIRPREVIPRGRLQLLAASPECTHHSQARGGKPINDQSRATAWHVLNWADKLSIDNLLIENVPEFQTWGPLGKNSRPLKKEKGKLFDAFIHSLRALGYTVDWRVLCCADYGDATTRQRLFILARRGQPVVWPDRTHGPGLPLPHRPARDIIDWSLEGKSIFGRKKKLSPNTIRRIAAGLKKFGGPAAEPFLIMLYGTGSARSVDRPLPAVTAQGGHFALCEPITPFVLGQQSGSVPRSVDKPVPTISTGGAIALVEPFVTHLTHHGGDRLHSVDQPLPTVTGAHRGELALVQPFITGVTHSCRQNNVHSVDRPMPTLTTAKGGEYALVQPFITKYYGTGAAVSVDEPLDTVTTKDRFLLVEPVSRAPVAALDIRLRMLQPHELAAAMSFPPGYHFTGTKEDQVKQIGNAVPTETAAALAAALL